MGEGLGQYRCKVVFSLQSWQNCNEKFSKMSFFFIFKVKILLSW